MGTQKIEVHPVTPHLGAEITGVNMAEPMDDQTLTKLRNALWAHGVIFFRDQDITPEQHLAFGRRFGQLHIHPFAPGLKDHAEILVLENNRERPPSINNWHSDVTFLERPALGSILRAIKVPEFGGDTLWASMYAAYDALSDTMQRFLSGLVAVHDFEHVFFGHSKLMFSDKTEDAHARVDKVAAARRRFPEMEHPVVRTHLETGKQALFVNSGFTTRIKDMSEKESRTLLNFLYEHLDSPDFQVRFRWQKNSVAFWDNRCTQHFAAADYWPHERHMQRVTIEGERPFYKA